MLGGRDVGSEAFERDSVPQRAGWGVAALDGAAEGAGGEGRVEAEDTGVDLRDAKHTHTHTERERETHAYARNGNSSMVLQHTISANRGRE